MADNKQAPLAIGAYVLATKYEDGDPGDQWSVGFFSGMQIDRYMVNDGDGRPYRGNGFRRCEVITKAQGDFMAANAKLIDASIYIAGNDRRSIWDYWLKLASLPTSESTL
jgi:hypothetical protein